MRRVGLASERAQNRDGIYIVLFKEKKLGTDIRSGGRIINSNEAKRMARSTEIAVAWNERKKTVILFRIAAALLVISAACGLSANSKEPSVDDALLLESVRARALEYSHSLPDFICDQTTHRDVSKRGGLDTGSKIMAQGGMVTPELIQQNAADRAKVIEEKLTFIGGHENYTVVSVDGIQVTGIDHLQFEGVTSSGEFGSLLQAIFDPESKSVITRGRMSTLRGHRAYVYAFYVPKEHGTVVFAKDTRKQVTVAIAGKVVVDANTLDVLQLDSTLEIPPGFRMETCAVKVDYRQTTIADQLYSLPFHAEVRIRDHSSLYVNQIDFRNYHKFTVKLTIHLSDDAPR